MKNDPLFEIASQEGEFDDDEMDMDMDM